MLADSERSEVAEIGGIGPRFRGVLAASNIHPATEKSNDIERIWLDYIFSTNKRGVTLVNKFKDQFGFDFEGKRVLDIGSGYGGLCLAAALEGADVVGIEFQKKLVDYSLENFRDFEFGDRIEVINRDVVNPETWKSLGQFDIIFCDNVIEHVHSPEGLVSAVGSLLKIGGYFYLTAPNAYSFGMLRSECHYGLLGASLLDPNDAAVMLSFIRGQKTEYDVSFYYDYAEYVEIFTRYGLDPKHLLPLDGSDAAVARAHNNFNELINDLEKVKLPDSIKDRYFERVRWYKNRFYADLNYFYGAKDAQERVSIAQRMSRDYEINLWYFVCKRAKK